MKKIILIGIVIMALFLTGCSFGTFDISIKEPISVKYDYETGTTTIPPQNTSISIDLHKEECTQEQILFCNEKDMVCVNRKCMEVN